MSCVQVEESGIGEGSTTAEDSRDEALLSKSQTPKRDIVSFQAIWSFP